MIICCSLLATRHHPDRTIANVLLDPEWNDSLFLRSGSFRTNLILVCEMQLADLAVLTTERNNFYARRYEQENSTWADTPVMLLSDVAVEVTRS